MDEDNRFTMGENNVPIFVATATGCGQANFLGMILCDKNGNRLNAYVRSRVDDGGEVKVVSIQKKGRTANSWWNRLLLRWTIRRGIKAAARAGSGKYKEMTVRHEATLEESLDKLIGSEIQFA